MRRSKRLKKTSAGIIDSEVKASTLRRVDGVLRRERLHAERQGEGGLVVQDEQRQDVAVPAAR